MTRRIPSTAAAFGAVAALLPSLAIAQEAVPSDLAIHLAVERELASDRATPENRIDVSVEDSTARLSGVVPNALARDRAVRLARTVRGVDSVVDSIVVAPVGTRSDAAIERDIEQALLSDPATDAYEVGVDVAYGVATLTGRVDSWRERELCTTVVKGVRGVVDIEDEIDVVVDSERADAEIRAEVEATLDWNVLVDSSSIDVGVAEGEVALTGTVDSASERWEAYRCAWTAGVQEVDTAGLAVADWGSVGQEDGPETVERSDAEIRAALERALAADARVDAGKIAPMVVDGRVSLTGMVDTLEAKQAARSVARATAGVEAVDNLLRVRLVDPLDDAEIADGILAALKRDAIVDRYGLDVSVYNGRAYLEGIVDSPFEAARARLLASRVAGVEQVVDLVDVMVPAVPTYDPWVDPFANQDLTAIVEPIATVEPDTAISEEIGEELFWSPFVDSDAVQVEVEDGVATLSGTVDDYSEELAAIENAYEGGAIVVKSDLALR